MEGLIKLTNEDNLFYDSVEKVYRYRMCCPQCGKPSGCRCFQDLEEAEIASLGECDYACSSRCSVMYAYEDDDDGIEDALEIINFKRPISDFTEDESLKIINAIYGDSVTRGDIRDIIDELKINKHVTQLSHDERIKIISNYNENVFSVSDICDELNIETGRKIESITEEEAIKVLEEANIDFDSPGGEYC